MRATGDVGSISRILYDVAAVTVIPLGRPLLDGSSDLPGSLAHRAGTHEDACASSSFLPYLVLLRVGFAMPRALLSGRCALTAPFHPYPDRSHGRYILCGTFRLTDLNPQSRTLSGTVLFGVRTFLSPFGAAQNIWRSPRDSDYPIQHQLDNIIRFFTRFAVTIREYVLHSLLN